MVNCLMFFVQTRSVCACVSIFTSVFFITLLVCTLCECVAGSLLWYVALTQHGPSEYYSSDNLKLINIGYQHSVFHSTFS